jgi:hypothetical protein
MFVDFYLEISKNRVYELIRRGTLQVMLKGVYIHICYHVCSIEKVDSSINAFDLCLRGFPLQNFSSLLILI